MQLIQITQESRIPLVGSIAFGIIDRGSNLLQIRPTTVCNQKCTFCSTSANNELHPINFEVEESYLIQWLKKVISLKQFAQPQRDMHNEMSNVTASVETKDIKYEANIDSVGEPTTYPYLIQLIKDIKLIEEIKFISMQTNGTLLNKILIKDLETAGLNRINLSIHSLDEQQSKLLFGNPNYSLKTILEAIKEIKNTKIELNLVPVWLPKVNDKEIIKLIELAKSLNCKIGIQKYEVTRYSRKEKKAKQTTWFKFFRELKELEKQTNYKLLQTPKDFNIIRTKKIPLEFQKNDIVQTEILCQGWFKEQLIATSKNRAITIVDYNKPFREGDKVRVKILDTQDSIYIAKKV